ncbi:IS30 family transposase [Caballeronia cordobensis]|uniref:IS30 family transposase n=1 Tax=Caballeronia cordobensis TaxID=1353886 RepID=UPI0006AD632A|nr:IS30 family transposase [Caballeronia cordobensis]
MKQRRRIYYSERQRALMWERWRAGESLQHIAQLFDRNHSSVAGILAQTGGIQPPPRRRSKRSLTLAEREEISRGLAAEDSIQSIARRLSRAPSTICREIKRNSGEKGYRADYSIQSIARRLSRAPSTICREIKRNSGEKGYRADCADGLAWQRALRPKACKLVATPALAKIVAAKLRLEWSPQQVAGWLKRAWPDSEGFHVSHETIYRTLFIQARGALKKELLGHLRRTRAMRRSRHHTQKTEDHGRIRDAVSISERPATVEDRAVSGHWEGDLLCGSGNSQIATLVERKTRYVMLVKVDSKDSETVANALIKHAGKLPQELYKSLTWDRGTEMAGHKRFTIATDIAVYFCDPKHPWQRGSNENTNGLLRQYFPRGIDLSVYSQAKLNAVARRLNERPRKTLDYETPAERFHQAIAPTG